MADDAPHWPEAMATAIRQLIADRTALATAVMATGEQAISQRWPGGSRLLCRHRRVDGELSWFLLDDEQLWWIVRQGPTSEAWRTLRTPQLNAALAELVTRLYALKDEAARLGRPWPKAVRTTQFGSESWTAG